MTPSQSSDESYKESTRTAWNATAETYRKVLRVLEPYGFDLLARVSPKIRESALDLAAGPGEPAMSIARMVGPDGRVVGIDLSEQMVELATRIAKDRRIPGLTFLVMDAEKLDFPDESFDLVTSRFGFQIFANPETVAREAYRVLRTKGRIGVAVWSTDRTNPIRWLAPRPRATGPSGPRPSHHLGPARGVRTTRSSRSSALKADSMLSRTGSPFSLPRIPPSPSGPAL